LAIGNEALYAQDDKMIDNPLVQDIHQKHVINFLKFIETDLNKKNVEKLYGRLGYECFYSRGLDKWVKSFNKNIDEFFDRVNRGDSKYWEKLEFDKENGQIKVKSRKFISCVCGFAQCENPPISLCNLCCKRFQEEIFQTLLQRKVNVRIDESILLGNERCCTTIFVNKT
jgi:hypothetical protein